MSNDKKPKKAKPAVIHGATNRGNALGGKLTESMKKVAPVAAPAKKKEPYLARRPGRLAAGLPQGLAVLEVAVPVQVPQVHVHMASPGMAPVCRAYMPWA